MSCNEHIYVGSSNNKKTIRRFGWMGIWANRPNLKKTDVQLSG